MANQIGQPAILYHYTTQDGLLGILKNKAIWATKIHYLNDATELSMPIRIASEWFAKQLAEGRPSLGRAITMRGALLGRMKEIISEWQDLNFCVASFCAEEDLLSQWRGYSNYGSAYAIGFDLSKLEKCLKGTAFELVKCEYYNTDSYKQKIETYVSDILDQALGKNEVPSKFVGTFMRMAARMKLDCFQEEKEWRIISYKPVECGEEAFKFRATKSMLVPFYEVPISRDSIVRIIIGPSQHPDLAMSSVNMLTNKYDLVDISIKNSSIPFRVF